MKILQINGRVKIQMTPDLTISTFLSVMIGLVEKYGYTLFRSRDKV